MTSSTTFTGTGTETDTYPDGTQLSYTFKVVKGTISKDGKVSWLCDSSDLNGKWRLKATMAVDGLTMNAAMSAVSGGVANGRGTYTRFQEASQVIGSTRKIDGGR